MRIKILCFAGGVGLLQMQARLPDEYVPLALLGGGALLLWELGRFRHGLAQALVLLGCTGLGFGWAAWLAQQRLADQLPAAWEGQDIQVVGVVAALPQSFERGERFEFAVESVAGAPLARVPQRIMLSWYHGWHDDEWHEVCLKA